MNMPVNDTPQSESAAQNTEGYKKLIAYMTQVLDQVKKGETPDVDQGIALLSTLTETSEQTDALFVAALHSTNNDDFLVSHSVNVALFLVKLAAAMGMPLQKQVELGSAGLFHDVGKSRVSGEILYKNGSLSNKEIKIVQEATRISHDALKPFENKYPYLPVTALQAYERLDGSGYPQGLKGREIHEYAQIVGLLDYFEALTHPRPYRDGHMHFLAVKDILDSNKGKFSRALLKAFLLTFSIFPLQTYVKLNTNAIGRVVETYPDNPLRPRVEILFDPRGRRVSNNNSVNLPDETLLFIRESMARKDVEAKEA